MQLLDHDASSNESSKSSSDDLNVCSAVTYAMMIPLGSDRVKISKRRIVYIKSRCCVSEEIVIHFDNVLGDMKIRKYYVCGVKDVADVLINIRWRW